METYDEYVKRERYSHIATFNKILLSVSGYMGIIFLGLLYMDLGKLQDSIKLLLDKVNTTQLFDILTNTNTLEQCALKVASFC